MTSAFSITHPIVLTVLRVALDDKEEEDVQKRSTPTLRWLRTTIPFRGDIEEHRLAFRLLSQTPAVEHVIIARGWTTTDDQNILLETLVLLPCLVTLNLRKHMQHATDRFLVRISYHHPYLRRLYLSYSSVTQSSLEAFCRLEELAIDSCTYVTNVDFCCETLRVLSASDTSIDDEGLWRAVHLECLRVGYCRWITTVQPFAATLRKLGAHGNCGISDEALRLAKNLVELNASDNSTITTVKPFAATLRELDVSSWTGGMNDEGLAEAMNLVRLDVSFNHKITKFPLSVRELIARGLPAFPCGVKGGVLKREAKKSHPLLVKFDVRGNQRV